MDSSTAEADAGSPFTSADAYVVLTRACAARGLPLDGARLLRFGENAIFRLADDAGDVVVRIARDMSRYDVARRELCVARWLTRIGIPSISVWEEVGDQPQVVVGHPVTYWHAADTGPSRPTVTDLAELLRVLHQQPVAPCPLPPLDPLAAVRHRLGQGLDLPEADIAFLQEQCAEVDEALATVKPELPTGPVHGDAHTGNLLGRAGAAVWSDFETFAVGMREWDLIPVAVGALRLGITTGQMAAFTRAYGFDVRSWAGFSVLRQARELGMTTWLAQNVAESRNIADEVTLRLRSLRTGDDNRGWTAF